MKYSRSGRFLNEQTYLETVCKKSLEKHTNCCMPTYPYVQCVYQTKCGKICVHCDKHCTNVELQMRKTFPHCRQELDD